MIDSKHVYRNVLCLHCIRFVFWLQKHIAAKKRKVSWVIQRPPDWAVKAACDFNVSHPWSRF